MTPLGWLGRKTSTQTNKQEELVKVEKLVNLIQKEFMKVEKLVNIIQEEFIKT